MEAFPLENIHGMTPDKLRSYPGLGNLPNEQAEKIIFSLFQLVSIFFEIQPIEDSYCIDNQLPVYLSENKEAA